MPALMRHLAAGMLFGVACGALASPPAPAWRVAQLHERVKAEPHAVLQELRRWRVEGVRLPPRQEFELQYVTSLAQRYVGDSAAAESTAQDMLAAARRVNSSEGVVYGLLALSYAYSTQQRYAQSHQMARAAEVASRAIAHPVLRVQALITAAQACSEQGQVTAADDLLQQAIALARRASTDLGLAMGLGALARRYESLGEIGPALPVVRELLAVSRRLHDDRRYAAALRQEGRLAAAGGQAERAIASGMAALAIYRQHQWTEQAAATLIDLSGLHLKLRQFEQAAACAHDVLRMPEGADLGSVGHYAHLSRGLALIGLGRIAEGRREAETGIALGRQSEGDGSVAGSYREYAAALRAAGLHADAAQMAARAQAATDRYLRTTFVYQQEAFAGQAPQQSSRRSQWLWAALAGMAGLCAGLAGWLYRRSRLARARLKAWRRSLREPGPRDPLAALYQRRAEQQQASQGRDPVLPRPGGAAYFWRSHRKL